MQIQSFYIANNNRIVNKGSSTLKNGNSHPRGVKSLIKSIRLLNLFSEKGGWTVNEMIEVLRYHRSSIHRIVDTFEAEGFLERDKKARNLYHLGPQIVRLEKSAAQNMDMERLARPYLDQLVKLTQETAHVYVLDNQLARCVASLEAPRPVRLVTSAGHIVPLHCTGVGKTLLSHMKKTEIEGVLAKEGLAKFTKDTICQRSRLLRELDQIRKEKLAYDREEYEVGVKCVAAPVFRAGGQLAAAISVAGPSDRMSEEVMRRFSVFVKEAARGFSEKLGDETSFNP